MSLRCVNCCQAELIYACTAPQLMYACSAIHLRIDVSIDVCKQAQQQQLRQIVRSRAKTSRGGAAPHACGVDELGFELLSRAGILVVPCSVLFTFVLVAFMCGFGCETNVFACASDLDTTWSMLVNVLSDSS